MSKVPRQQVAEEFCEVINNALDCVGGVRMRYGTNDVVLVAYVDTDEYAEIRSAPRADVLEIAKNKWHVAELTAWLEQERPVTVCPLIIFDNRGESETSSVYWMRLKVEGTLGVLN